MKAKHPGESLRVNFMEPMKLTVTELAEKLGVSKSALSRLLAGKSAMTADMAVRLGFLPLGNPKDWMAAQAAYDIERARAAIDQSTVTPIL